MSKKNFIRACTLIVCAFLVVITGFVIMEENNGNLKESELTSEEIAEKKSDVIVVRKTEKSDQYSYTNLKKGKFKMASTEDIFMPISNVRIFNNELQMYIPDQLEYIDDNVIINADKIGANYVSGKTESKMAFRYGEFSFRVKLMEGKGFFPAIWMMPANGESTPEVDLFELIGSEPDRFHGVMHYIDNGERSVTEHVHSFGTNIPESFILTFKWTEDYILWQVNGTEVQRITDHVPNIPMYMIMNLAIGGNWPGSPDENTVFPNDFTVQVLNFDPKETYIRD